MYPEDMTSSESERLISLLKNAIRLSNFTYRDVERQLGWRVGTITRLMRGGLGLKIEHLLMILGVIHFSPARFFAAAYPYERGGNPMEDRMQRMLEQLHGEPEAYREISSPRASRAAGELAQEDVDEMVRLSLQRLISSGGERAEDADESQPERKKG